VIATLAVLATEESLRMTVLDKIDTPEPRVHMMAVDGEVVEVTVTLIDTAELLEGKTPVHIRGIEFC
jgi:hypothetical protein